MSHYLIFCAKSQNFQNCLTFCFCCDIINKSHGEFFICEIYGCVAQLARATGSYPVGRWFKSCRSHFWPVGQAAKTTPFHGVIMGSIPVRVTIQRSRKQRNIAVSEFFFYSENPLCSLSVLYFENAE